MEIARTKEVQLLQDRLRRASAAALLGPRQCGKTTLARQFARTWKDSPVHTFDLENPRDLAALENPLLALEALQGLVVIDEIQRRRDLFPVLRVLIDKRPRTRYLLLGSASRDLLAQSSETLAGRLTYLEIGGFTLSHVPVSSAKKLWLRGSFPRSFLAAGERASLRWRQDFIATFLERDVPNLGIRIPALTLRRFWTMIAHYHGQLFNASDMGRSLGVSDSAARHYLDVLSATFLVRQLQPWFYNTKKRLVKRPKVYLRDSGLLHALLSLETEHHVVQHPKLGSSWEGFALEQVIQQFDLRDEDAFFWAVHTGAELDLVFRKGGRLWGAEMKYKDAPTLTPSMVSAVEELALAHLWVIYPGANSYSLQKKVTVVPLGKLNTIKI